MSKGGKIQGGSGVDWSGALAAESEPVSFEVRVCPFGKPELGPDPEVGLANWKKERGDRIAEEKVKSNLLTRSVRDALIASKQEVREVISEGRRRRSRGRMNDQNRTAALQASSGSDYTMATFWQAQNRRDDDDYARRNAATPIEEPTDRKPSK